MTYNEAVVECQHCGDLFELKTLLLPSGHSISFTFSPFVNLVMMVTGSANIISYQSSFELTMGQVWLAGSEEEYKLSNNGGDQEAVLICVGIREAMLARFYERHDNALLRKTQALNVVKSMLPRGKAPIVFPSCDLTKLTLDSFQLFRQLGDDRLNALKLEELLLLKLKGDHGQILASELLNRVNPAQEKFRRFMEANVTKNWTIATYAEHMGMSLTSFKDMFGQVFKESSPKMWINERRLRHADIQLRTSSRRLIDIAVESGFSSQSYFTQLYKSKYGIAPSEARQKRI
ncbi:helix-turn-helix transcriptional regulator [Microbulbifer sp. CNSA002]|uniref:helix-turn-helix transcriptional regulator n=1 Tax=unclassified Microbulbifer TaxID=2619833 RepID=UPI0039B44B9C